MNRLSVSFAIFLALGLLLWQLWSNKPAEVVLNETFDSLSLSVQGQDIIDHRLTHLAADEGVDGTTAVKVEYQGYERGSRRVVVSPRIEPSQQYQLSFWVRFCDDFDFARGGKLHGLGPANPVTGGKEITPEGWSARLMFRRNGGLMTYIYHQDMPGKYGDTKVAKNFKFIPGKYYNIKMRVVLNQPAREANGIVEVDVDDRRVIEHTGLRFRAKEGEDGMIQRLLFNTFHGGSAMEWAPRSADGSLKKDCAYFDDFVIGK